MLLGLLLQRVSRRLFFHPSWCAPLSPTRRLDSRLGSWLTAPCHGVALSRLPAEVGTVRSTGPDYRQGNDQGFAGREAACCGLATGTKLVVPGYSLLASVCAGDRSIAEGSSLYALPSRSLCNSEWKVASPLSTRCRRIVQGSFLVVHFKAKPLSNIVPRAKLTRPVQGMQGWTDLA